MYTVMYGEFGCLPDTVQVHESFEGALYSATDEFVDDIELVEYVELVHDLTEIPGGGGCHKFSLPHVVGVEYVEIVEVDKADEDMVQSGDIYREDW
jgi:hypothetical protein